MRRIIFVDDEPKVLEGLKRMLRSMRHGWEMAFVESGAEALAALDAKPYDVVVSDMRMPGMDGAQLLTEVMNRHPQTVRIILSGYADQELVMRSVGAAHQFLSKPCDAETLKNAVGHACSLRDLLSNASLQRIVSQMESLPSLPSLYTELIQELQSPDASIKKVGEIISLDLGMTAKILQMVNSAFFGLRRNISSPTEAAMFLGIDTIMSLVLAIHVFSQFNASKLRGFTPQALWSHSMATGLFAKRIAKAEKLGNKVAEDAFTAGLLHDSGKVVLAANLPEWYEQALTLTKTEEISLVEAEQDIFGTTHAEIGAYLLGLWGLPESIIEAVAFHHCPSQCLTQSFSPLTLVHVANALQHEPEAGKQKEVVSQLDTEYLAQLHLADRLDTWQEFRVSGDLEKAA